MTLRIIITILLLATVLPGTNSAFAGREKKTISVNEHVGFGINTTPVAALPQSDRKLPVFPASKPEAPHHKAAHVPHMEELPHIHRYHKERVKKMQQHHTKFWFMSKLIVVVCHLSLLLIAYLHIVH